MAFYHHSSCCIDARWVWQTRALFRLLDFRRAFVFFSLMPIEMEKYDKFFFFFKFLYAHFFSLCNAKIFQLNHWVRGFWNAWSLSGLPRGLNLWIKRTPKNTSKSFRECNSNDDLFWQLCYKLSRIIHLHDLLVTNISFFSNKIFSCKNLDVLTLTIANIARRGWSNDKRYQDKI